jgi:hypothetical protein
MFGLDSFDSIGFFRFYTSNRGVSKPLYFFVGVYFSENVDSEFFHTLCASKFIGSDIIRFRTARFKVIVKRPLHSVINRFTYLSGRRCSVTAARAVYGVYNVRERIKHGNVKRIVL